LDANRTLLIVEDDEEVSKLMRDVLETKGFRCLIEYHGENVLDRALMDQPALILLDIKLTGIDGFTVCRRIKREPMTKAIPVIFISALNTEKDVIEAREAGGVYFLSKPFDLTFLSRKIEETLIGLSTPLAPTIRVKLLYAQSEYSQDIVETHADFFKLLRESSMEITTVRDSREILRRAKEIRPHVIVLDLDNALLEAATIAETLWRNRETRDIPVFVLTAQSEKERLFRLGIHGKLTVFKKPADYPRLIESVRSALNGVIPK
jgi:DNA-binding response OmpR family regulator